MSFVKKSFRRTTLCCAIIALSHVRPTMAQSPSFLSPYGMRFTGQGFLTTEHNASAYADGFVPVIGDMNRLLFVDGSFLQSRGKAFVGSAGAGIRTAMATPWGDTIYGFYTMADYLRTPQSNNAWVINPGLEVLTLSRELRFNAYIPSGKRDKGFATTFASTIPQNALDDTGEPGDDLVSARGNEFIDTPVLLTEELPVGGELEVGQKVWFGIWARAAGYYFDYKRSKNTTGGLVSFDVPLRVPGAHLLLMDSYDNRRKNLFSIGLRYNMGDTGEKYPGVLSRMTTPIERHWATRQTGGSVPVNFSYKRNGASIVRDNVFFFDEENGQDPGDGFIGQYVGAVCTAENPCRSFNQTAIDGIEDNISANNNYYFIANGQYGNQNELITLNRLGGHAEVWGFSNGDFNQQSTQNNRPTILGGLFFGDMREVNDGNSGDEVTATIRNLIVTTKNTDVDGAQSGRATSSMSIGATSDLSVTNTKATVENFITTDAVGIFSTQGDITVSESYVDSRVSVNLPDNDAFGVYAFGGNANVTDSIIQVHETGDGNSNYSVAVIARGDATVADSILEAEASGSGENLDSFGVFSFTGNITTSNSTITALTREEGDGSGAFAIRSFGGGNISSSNDIILARVTTDGDNNDAYAVTAPNGGNITISGSSITANVEDALIGNRNTAYGVVTSDGNIEINDTEISAVSNSTGRYNTSVAVAVFSDENTADEGGNIGERNITISNSTLTAETDGVGDDSSAFGVLTNTDGRVTISDSTFTVAAQDNGERNLAIGVAINDPFLNPQGSNVSVSGTTITVSNNGDGIFGLARGVSIDLGDISVTNSTVNVVSAGNHASVDPNQANDAAGLLALKGDITVSDESVISATVSGTGDNSDARAIRAIRADNIGGDVTVSNSTATAIVTDAANGNNTTAIAVSADNEATISYSEINAITNSDGVGDDATGVLSSSRAIIENSIVTAQVNGNGAEKDIAGVIANNNGVEITSSTITAEATSIVDSDNNQVRGVNTANGGNLTLNNTTVFARNVHFGDGNDTAAVVGSGTITIGNNSDIEAIASGEGNSNFAKAIENTSNGTVTVSNSTIEATTRGNGNQNDTVGIQANNNITVTGSTVTVTGEGSGNDSEAIGLYQDNDGAGDKLITFINSTITVSEQGNGLRSEAVGIYNKGGNVTVDASQISVSDTVNSNDSEAVGVIADYADAAINISNGSTIVVRGAGGQADDAVGLSATTVNFSGIGDPSAINTYVDDALGDGTAISAAVTTVNNNNNSTCDGDVCPERPQI
jgi:hypothetical protein